MLITILQRKCLGPDFQSEDQVVCKRLLELQAGRQTDVLMQMCPASRPSWAFLVQQGTTWSLDRVASQQLCVQLYIDRSGRTIRGPFFVVSSTDLVIASTSDYLLEKLYGS